jgi:two-component system response regulator AlgR
MTGELTALIVDDEPLAVERLQILCAREPGIRLVGIACDGASALRLVDALEPDLLFLDIGMPGMTGVEVAAALECKARRPAIVFVTAFDSFAVAAFDAAAVDYLLKPVAPERLARAIARVADRIGERGAAPAGQAAPAPFPQDFWVPNRGELVRVAVGDIERIEAERDYMRLVSCGRSWLIHETISALEARLDPTLFIRLHRSTIVRRDQIVRLAHDGQGNWTADLVGGASVRIGRTYLARVRASVVG